MPPKSPRKKRAPSALELKDGHPKIGGVTTEFHSKKDYIEYIMDLEARLAKYERKYEALEQESLANREVLTKIDREQKDSTAFWRTQIAEKADDIHDLKDRMAGLQLDKDEQRDHYEAELQELRNEFQETKDVLTTDNLNKGSKLTALEEFKLKKEELHIKYDEMVKELEEKEQKHQDIVQRMQEKAEHDKDALKKEMVNRVNQVAAEFRKNSNKQMADTTKRTIRDNQSIQAQIAKLADKRRDQEDENEELKRSTQEQAEKIKNMEEAEKVMMKDNYSTGQIVKMLRDKDAYQNAVINMYQRRMEHSEDLDEENIALRIRRQENAEDLYDLKETRDEFRIQLRTSRRALKREKRSTRNLEKTLQDAATVLQGMLRSTTGPVQPESVSEDKEGMLEDLLAQLTAAGKGDAGKLYRVRQKSASKVPATGEGLQRGQVPFSPIAPREGTQPHYQLGDLGLVPHVAQTIPTSKDKMKDVYDADQVGDLRAVLTKSVAIQTVSAPKAMFYADKNTKKSHSTTQEAVLHELQPPRRPKIQFSPLIATKAPSTGRKK